MQRKSRKIIKPTGDPSIDAFSQMHNTQVRAKGRQAPSLMSVSEERLLLEIIPKYGVGRIVAETMAKAQYLKIRLRKFMKHLHPMNELLGSSQQDNEIIVWRYRKYGAWRIKPPVEDSPIYKDAQAEIVTCYVNYGKGSDKNDTDTIKNIADTYKNKRGDGDKSDNKWNGIDLEAMLIIIETNYEKKIISKLEFETTKAEIESEIERRKGEQA